MRAQHFSLHNRSPVLWGQGAGSDGIPEPTESALAGQGCIASDEIWRRDGLSRTAPIMRPSIVQDRPKARHMDTPAAQLI